MAIPPIPIALRLAGRQWLARPLRPILCSLAIAAAVALVICVGAAMDSLRFSISTAIGQILGVAEVHVRPAQRDTDARVSQAVLDQVRALPEVDFADGRLYAHAALTVLPSTAASRPTAETHWFDAVGIDPDMDAKLRPNTYAGRLHDNLGPDDLMIDSLVADELQLHLGDHIAYTTDGTHSRTVTVAAIVHRPSLEIIARPTLYVPLATLVRDTGIAGEYTVIDIKLKDSANITDYDAYARDLGKRLGPEVDVTPGTTSRAKLTSLTRTLNVMLVLLSVTASWCTALIIGTTLSVGVQERVRQFGQLRCLGASRRQLVGFLAGDAALMLALGLAIGIAGGIALSAGLVSWFPQLFIAYKISTGSLISALCSGGLATALGAAIPAWQVTRVSPMAAVAAVAQPSAQRHVRRVAVVGIACLAAQILLWFAMPSREAQFLSYAILGVPLIFAGWALLAPAILVACERTAAAVLGRIGGVQPSLLRHAWSRTPWRSGAMIAALMLGVVLFTTVRARGASLLASWVTPARLPDLIIKSLAGGFTDRRIAMIEADHPELRQFSVFDWCSVKLNTSVFRMGQLLDIPDTTFIAVDPDTFTDFVELEYLDGNPQTALAQLHQGGYVFVSKEYRNMRGLGVGDKISITSYDGKPVDFTIAAVVTSTGVELVKNYFDLRAGYHDRSISSVLGSVDDARKYFHVKDPTLALVNLRADAAQRAPVTALRRKLETEGFQMVSSVELKTTIFGLVQRIMDSLSVIAIGALAVASLGVANMVIASVHARRYEFGVLRAIGAGRGQLVRLVLAEVTLIGLVAGTLGAATGLQLAYMATRLDLLVIGANTSFLAVGFPKALLVAVTLVAQALVLTTALAWLASLVPALRGATAAQRTMLAAGRA